MKSFCVFVSYTESDHRVDLPFLAELQRHFDAVLMVTNIAPDVVDFPFLVLPNKGYDFGFVYRALPHIDLSDIDFLGIVNNSQILLEGRNLDTFFEWCRASPAKVCGLTDSFEAPPGVDPEHSYHIQSSFLVLKDAAVEFFPRFFQEIEFERFFDIKDARKLRRTIIRECEIGLSQFMLKNGMKLEAWFAAETFNSQHRLPATSNMHVLLWEQLILAGYPLIKKKIISGAWDKLIPQPFNRYKYLGTLEDRRSTEESRTTRIGYIQPKSGLARLRIFVLGRLRAFQRFLWR